MIPFPNKQYDIIYADPPWEYEETGGIKSSRGMAKQHYSLMSMNELIELPVKHLCYDTTVCFMWATFPKIDRAIELMRSWGFIYKTAAFVWVKMNKKTPTPFFGMGAWTRANAEVCLLGIGVNSKAKSLVKSHSVSQVIIEPIGAHSSKPKIVAEKIVELLGDVSRIELFARDKKIGWDSWGNEI